MEEMVIHFTQDGKIIESRVSSIIPQDGDKVIITDGIERNVIERTFDYSVKTPAARIELANIDPYWG